MSRRLQLISILFFLWQCLFFCFNAASQPSIVIKTAITASKLSPEWKDALRSRMSPDRIDSFARIQRTLTDSEEAWQRMIESRKNIWNAFRDSLQVPFGKMDLDDTITVLLGYLGTDDGFTYHNNTVCLDLSALQGAYGNAGLPENQARIDRIFAHEYTHLLHKAWAKQYRYHPVNFRDSILWECLYEGIGMYRSLNPKWLPINDSLPKLTTVTVEKILPVFVDRLTKIENAITLTEEEKMRLHDHLSRGQVHEKWGALPVAIWFAIEAAGNDARLFKWIDHGPNAVILLAKKYLPAHLKTVFVATFP
jgi:hypothetical protein